MPGASSGRTSPSSGGKLDEKGQSKGWNISKSAFRAMVDSALGLDPQDESPAAKGKRVIQGLKQLDGIVFAARIMVEPASSPQYKDANKLANVVLPGEPQYAATMRGESVPARSGQCQAAQRRPKRRPHRDLPGARPQRPSQHRGRRAVGEPERIELRRRARPRPVQPGSTADAAAVTDDEWQAHVIMRRRRRSANGSKEEEGFISQSAV